LFGGGRLGDVRRGLGDLWLGECRRPERRVGLDLFLESLGLSSLVAAVRARGVRRAVSAMKMKARFTEFILDGLGWGTRVSASCVAVR